MCCFFAMLTWNAVIAGRSNRSAGGCGVQFVFGVMLICYSACKIDPHTRGIGVEN
jgi:hypothetical protein